MAVDGRCNCGECDADILVWRSWMGACASTVMKQIVGTVFFNAFIAAPYPVYHNMFLEMHVPFNRPVERHMVPW
jgi:hypothetical protein